MRCAEQMLKRRVEEMTAEGRVQHFYFFLFSIPFLSIFSLSLSVQCHFCSFLRLNEISIMCAWWCWLRRWLTLHTASFVVTAVVLANTKHWHVYAKSCASVWRSAAVIIIFFHCVNSFFFFILLFFVHSHFRSTSFMCVPHTRMPHSCWLIRTIWQQQQRRMDKCAIWERGNNLLRNDLSIDEKFDINPT